MAPSGRRRRAKTTRKPRRSTISTIKKLVDQSKKQEKSTAAISPIKNSENSLLKNNNGGGEFTSGVVVDDDIGCTTPKGKRFRLPEIVTCPPAPMKRRVPINCALRRTPIAFFAPQDLELFFVYALGRDVSI